MRYNTLGKSGLVVSRMAFGAMTFGRAEGAFASIHKVDQALANQLVGRALDAGVNFFNSADAYAGGDSERMLGTALGKHRSDVVIATKVGFRTAPGLVHQGLSRHHILSAVEASLRRLDTDYLDVYLVHLIDPLTPLEETLEALQTAVSQGKVRYVGFSNWPAWLAAKAVGIQERRGWSTFRAAEMYYSLVGRDVENEIVPFATDAGVGLMVWSPLAGGFLSGKYTRDKQGNQDGRLTGFDIIPMDKDRAFDVVDRQRSIASAHGATPAQVALAWLLSKPAVSTVMIGASKMQQLEDNLAAADLTLNPSELADLDALTQQPRPYPGWFIHNIPGDAQVLKALHEGLPAVEPVS